MRKSAPIETVILLFSLIFAFGFNGRAQNSQPTEYQIKAAFIYHFAMFVDWPTQVFADASSPMVVGVLGKNVFGDNLEQAINGKIIQGHPLQFKEFNSMDQATNCQVLFISTSEKSHLSSILAHINGTSILTVSEMDNFTRDGGMINLVVVEDKVRFQINNDAAKKAGLTISSKLLSLAINNQ
jgi:hypothetical protein